MKSEKIHIVFEQNINALLFVICWKLVNKLYFHDYKFMFIPPPNTCLEDVLIHKNIISETIKKKKHFIDSLYLIQNK